MNEKKMVGKRSVLFSRPPIIIGAGSVAGEKEGVYTIALALSRKILVAVSLELLESRSLVRILPCRC